MLPNPCVAPRSEVSGAGEVPTGTTVDVHLVLEAQVAAAVAHLLLREVDHAAYWDLRVATYAIISQCC